MVKDLTSTDLIIREYGMQIIKYGYKWTSIKKVDTTNQQHQLMEKENGFIVKYIRKTRAFNVLSLSFRHILKTVNQPFVCR